MLVPFAFEMDEVIHRKQTQPKLYQVENLKQLT